MKFFPKKDGTKKAHVSLSAPKRTRTKSYLGKLFGYVSLAAMQIGLAGSPTISKASSSLPISKSKEEFNLEGGNPPLQSRVRDQKAQSEYLKSIGLEFSQEKPGLGEYHLDRYKTAPGFGHLSLTNAVRFLELNVLENMRLNGNYGHPGKSLFRPSQDPTHLSRDCARDSVATFIQFLFPSGDLTQLNLTTNAGDFVFTLEPEEIGHVLKIISTYQKGDEAGKKDIARELLSLFKGKAGYKDTIDKEINKKVAAEKTKRTLKHKGEFVEKYSEDADIQDALKSLYGAINEGKTLSESEDYKKFLGTVLGTRFSKNHGKYLKEESVSKAYKSINDAYKSDQKRVSADINTEMTAFKETLLLDQKVERLTSANWLPAPLNTVMTALKKEGASNQKDAIKRDPYYFIGMLFEALDHQEKEGSIYEDHTVEKALLALAWRKSDGQEEGISNLLRPLNGLIEKEANPNIPLTKANYMKFKEFSKNTGELEKILPKIFDMDPDFAFFIKNGVNKYEATLPENLNYGEASVTNDKGVEIRFPDCGSTSFRNFLNILLFDAQTGRFSVNHLQELRDQGGRLNKVMDYYQKYSTPSLMRSQKARDDFAKITSGLQNVEYTKENFAEIDAGLRNMLQVFLGVAPNLFEEKDIDNKAYEILSTFAGKIKRPELKIQWSIPEDRIDFTDNAKGIMNLDFTLDKKPVQWQFLEGHFSLDYEADKVKWQNKFPSILKKPLGEELTVTSPFYLHTASLDEGLLKGRPSKDFWTSLWRSDLNNDAEIKKAIGLYLEKKSKDKDFSLENDGVLLKLFSKLQLEDDITQEFLLKMFVAYPQALDIEEKIPGTEKTLSGYKPFYLDGRSVGDIEKIMRALGQAQIKSLKKVSAIGTLCRGNRDTEDITSIISAFDHYNLRSAEEILSIAALCGESRDTKNIIKVMNTLDNYSIRSVEEISALKELCGEDAKTEDIGKILKKLDEYDTRSSEDILSIATLCGKGANAEDIGKILEKLDEYDLRSSEDILSIAALCGKSANVKGVGKILEKLDEYDLRSPEAISALKELCGEDANAEDTGKIIDGLGNTGIKYPEEISALKELSGQDASLEDIGKIIKILHKISPKDSNRFLNIKSLFTDKMSREDRFGIMDHLLAFELKSPTQVAAIKKLCGEEMDANDIGKIIQSLSGSDFKHPRVILPIKELFGEGMDANDIGKLIKALSDRQIKDSEVIKSLGQSVTKDMGISERIEVIQNYKK